MPYVNSYSKVGHQVGTILRNYGNLRRRVPSGRSQPPVVGLWSHFLLPGIP